MSDFPTQKITIYHKEEDLSYSKFVVIASVRHTYTLNHNKTGNSSVDSVLIRIFDIDNTDYSVKKGDIIVEKEVDDKIEGTTPQTQLSKKYGQDCVFKVNTAEYFSFSDEDLKEENHTKVGCI